MGFLTQPDQPPARPSRLRFLLFLALVYGCVKVFGNAHVHPPHPIHAAPPAPLAIVAVPDIADNTNSVSRLIHFRGRRVWGNGTSIDLGDRRTHLPGSLLSRFFPDEYVLASCLTEIPPPAPPAQKQLPVRDDWPGFYGAPWIARLDGNLVVLLNVYAPRHSGLPLPSPEFQIYPDYEGQPVPALSIQAPAKLYRGSKAVLYRVFLTGPAAGPVRCLDLKVQNGENNGIGHLYYQKYHHYYQSDASFVIQQQPGNNPAKTGQNP